MTCDTRDSRLHLGMVSHHSYPQPPPLQATKLVSTESTLSSHPDTGTPAPSPRIVKEEMFYYD